MQSVLLASGNRAKQFMLRRLLRGTGVLAVSPFSPFSVPETGRTHLENAEAKALAWSHHFGMAAIASDGGLAIPVLGDRWDALLTARAAGPSATNRERLDHLLGLMRPYYGPQRTAHWQEAVALAVGGVALASWSIDSKPGFLEESYHPKRIVPGLWAFTIWRPAGCDRAYGELTREEVAGLDDHWARLGQLLHRWIREEGRQSLSPHHG